jgi:hypothetical protein
MINQAPDQIVYDKKMRRNFELDLRWRPTICLNDFSAQLDSPQVAFAKLRLPLLGILYHFTIFILVI